MAGRIIVLTPPRRIKEPPFIDTSIRADIADYGPPGDHLHGPLALKGRARATALGIPTTHDGEGELPDPLAACIGGGGDVIQFSPTVIGVATTIATLGPLARGFILTHIFALTDTATLGNQSFLIKIADDQDTTGGFDTTGAPVGRPRGGSDTFLVNSTRIDMYPNFPVRTPNKTIKLITRVTTAVTAIFRIELGLLWAN